MPDIASLLRLNSVFGHQNPQATVTPINSDPFQIKSQMIDPRQELDPFAARVNTGLQGVFQPPQDVAMQAAMTPRDSSASGYNMNAMYTPEHYFSDEYKKAYEAMPQRQKPSLMRRIGGMFMQPEEQEGFVYAPYMQQMADWGTRMKALEPGLNAERYANAQERQNVANILTSQAADKRASIYAEDTASKIADRERGRDIQQQRADTYSWSRRHPNHVIKENDDGYLIGIDPQTNAAEYILDDKGKQVRASDLDERTKLELQIEGRKAVARIQGANAIARTREAGAQERQNIPLRGAEQRETKTTPTEGGVTTETEREETVLGPDGKPIGTRKVKTTQKKTPANVRKVKMIRKNSKGDTEIRYVDESQVKEAEARGAKRAP